MFRVLGFSLGFRALGFRARAEGGLRGFGL